MDLNTSFTKRLSLLKDTLSQVNVDAILVSDPSNMLYLTGFSSAYMLIVPVDHEPILVVKRLEALRAAEVSYVKNIAVYSPYSKTTLPGEKVYFMQPHQLIQKLLIESKLENTTLGLEEGSISHVEYSKLRSKLKDTNLRDLSNVVRQMREVKDQQEIAFIKKAISLVEDSMKRAVDSIQPGIEEFKIAAKVVQALWLKGAKPSFEPIVVAGPRSAHPHEYPTGKKLENGDFVVMDLGAKWENYCSDLTRTIVIGSPTSKQRKMMKIVAEAQQAAIDSLRAGCHSSDPESAASNVISQHGLGSYFTHTTGHGIGLEVHESPSLSQRTNGQTLRSGMVITIEPGVYLPGYGGVRIEDMILVTHSGCEMLTSFKQLLY